MFRCVVFLSLVTTEALIQNNFAFIKELEASQPCFLRGSRGHLIRAGWALILRGGSDVSSKFQIDATVSQEDDQLLRRANKFWDVLNRDQSFSDSLKWSYTNQFGEVLGLLSARADCIQRGNVTTVFLARVVNDSLKSKEVIYGFCISAFAGDQLPLAEKTFVVAVKELR